MHSYTYFKLIVGRTRNKHGFLVKTPVQMLVSYHFNTLSDENNQKKYRKPSPEGIKFC